MLRYEVKLSSDNFKRGKLEYNERYLSRDLSFISGVTSPSYHLEKFKELAAKNSIVNSDSTLSVEAHNVIRQGYVVVVGKEIPVLSGNVFDYSSEKEGKEIEYRYVDINGKYFYENNGEFHIDNILNCAEEGGEISDEIESGVTVAADGGCIKVNAVYWIEDNTVNIDGNEYEYDNEESNGILKYKKDGLPLSASQITKCDRIECHHYQSPTEYEEVTKFKLTKQDEISEPFESISFCKYFYYIKYKNHYCEIKKLSIGDSYEFVCEIPKYVISGGSMEDGLEPKEYKVYFSYDVGNESMMNAYAEAIENNQFLNYDNYNKHGVKEFNELKSILAFVYVEEDEAYFRVTYDVLNANSSNEIILHMSNIYSPLKVGEKVEFVNSSENEFYSTVYNSNSFGGKNEEFVFLNGRKYLVEKNICDKVLINDNEYDIDYINGKELSADCLVLVGEERVPMKITNVSEDDGKVERYGLIVSGNHNEYAKKAEYKIRAYNGIYVNGERYLIRENDDGNAYAVITLQQKYTFIVSDIMGNSTYICEPFVNKTDFTDDFSRFISEMTCNDVVSSQDNIDLQIKNKIFGESEITKELAFRATEEPFSSSDFYDLFKDLDVYTDSGYIHIPLALNMNAANNIMQDDIVTRDFFEARKKRAINPIVDMEKDVYTPKYIYGYYTDENHERVHQYDNGEAHMYSGSSTIFRPITQINLNFHFRTRNLVNWRINDGSTNFQYGNDRNNESLDNWFITDFYPYKYILDERREESGDTLQEASDLMGLLYFTDDDIFYQRDKVGKSFARVSFYDSTDPQTQSLLSTSSIFVDEHKLFKRFIDNSRRNINDYGYVSEPQYGRNDSGFTDETSERTANFIKVNKIHISTELLGRTINNVEYGRREDSINVIIDENNRISSRLVVDNKYNTDTSSEGFYAYIFREYAENLHPKPIYMKIEFNHAGVGRTIPFLIPMHWSGNTTDSGGTAYNKMYPEHALRFTSTSANSITGIDDLEELKQGIPLSYVYAQTYIPLYAVYDFDRKEYGYVFDSRYVTQDDDGVINLNLFELKVMNESNEIVNDVMLNDIKLNMPIRAIININEEQFNKNSFNYEVE